MPPVNPALYLQARTDHPASSFRRLSTALLGLTTSVVTQSGYLAVAQRAAGANMSVDIASGTALVPDKLTYPGHYLLDNQGTDNVAIAAADAVNPRIDLVIMRVTDTEDNAPDLTDTVTFEVLTVTPAPVPTAPTVPATYQAIELAEVAVAPLATSIVNANITDLRNVQETIASLAADLAAAEASILANASNISTNTSTIGGHTSTLAVHGADIAVNAADIATNDTDISALQAKTTQMSYTTGDTAFAGVVSVAGALDVEGNLTLGSMSIGTNGVHDRTGDIYIRHTGANRVRSKAAGVDVYMPSTTATTNNVVAQGPGGATRELRVSTSSIRFKRAIVDISPQRALEILEGIRPIAYESNIEGEVGVKNLGFSAENVAETEALLASYEDDGETPRGINDTGLLATLWQVVKTQEERIAALEASS